MYFSKMPLIPKNRNSEFETRALIELGEASREIYIMTKDNVSANIDQFPIPKEGELLPVLRPFFHSKGKTKSPTITEKPSIKSNLDIPDIHKKPNHKELTPIFYGSIKLKNGSYLIFANMLHNNIVPPISSTILYTIILITLLGTCFFYLLIKEITSPLKKLASQADIISRDYQAKTLPIQGPLEIQELMFSFNRMQERLSSFISDRTRILASVSHDLKTPLTSMMLRAQFLPDCEDKEKLISSIDIMTKMVKTTLLFARSEENLQESECVHLPSLIESICEDYIDTGKAITYEEKTSFLKSTKFQCRPLEIHRIMQNLIDNALQYGTKVTVELSEQDDEVVIEIGDNGPGIPENKYEEVFSPFTRLDKARNTNNAHVGLGLSIVRNTILKQGGTIFLSKSKSNGLLVTIKYKI